MVTRDLDGFTIKRTGKESPYYIRHKYTVTGVSRDGSATLGGCRNKKEALALVRKNWRQFDEVHIADEWIGEDIHPWTGRPILRDVVSHTTERYIHGRLSSKTKLL